MSEEIKPVLTDEADSLKGVFGASISRSSKEIRRDRGLAIYEEAELLYKRRIEDVETVIKRLNREKTMMTDFAPGDKNSLNFADFDGNKFVARSEELVLQVREKRVLLNELKNEYNRLFGEKYELEVI